MSSRTIKIAPSVLAGDLSRLADEVKALEKAGADLIHLDIMDGRFVPNFTFGPPVVAALRQHTKLPFDAHLMVEDPDRHLEAFAKAGCGWLSVHIEACPHILRTLARIRELGVKAGVAINPGTALTALDAVLDFADYILVMSVNPGFAGQKFIPGSFERVKALRLKLGGRSVQIEIDGGITEGNFAEAVAAGIDMAVLGTGILAQKDYAAAIATLRTKS